MAPNSNMTYSGVVGLDLPIDRTVLVIFFLIIGFPFLFDNLDDEFSHVTLADAIAAVVTFLVS